jgi:hypothetical protein
MSEDKNLERKSIQDLEKEKLQAEIDILNARLATEFPLQDSNKTGFFAKVAIHAKGWATFILGAVTLISAVWGVFVPLSEYLIEQRRALEYQLNENMIGFVDDLNSEDPNIANRGVMMLSYYEVNSIPILMFFLEGSRNDQEEFRERIIGTISLIYEESREDIIFEQVQRKMESAFLQIVTDYKNAAMDPPFGNGIQSSTRRVLLNYIDLLKGMNLRSGDKEDIERMYRDFKSEICQDENLVFEIYGIFSEISTFLGEDFSCD